MGTHVMIDLETWGTGPTSVIRSLGAVKFDPNLRGLHDTTTMPLERISDAIYVVIDPKSCQHFGLTIDAETMEWWTHSDRQEARLALEKSMQMDLASTLDSFARWFGNTSLPVWGNGSDFDNVILGNAFKALNMELPWKHRHNRCFRTIKNLAPLIETPPVGVGHQALDDATWQAYHLQNIATELGLEIS